jgi:cytoskeleton protein RodZ
MTDSPAASVPGDGRSAGQLLREARLAKDLSVAALAGQLRVSVSRLEALEADQIDELHGAAYTRSLALAVCRALGVDAGPVLQRLPMPDDSALGEVGPGLNTPFREGSARLRGDALGWLSRPIVWGPMLFLVASAVVWWWPQDGQLPGVTTVAVTPLPAAGPAPAIAPPPPATPPADTAVPATAAPSAPSVETVHSAPPPSAAAAVDLSRPLQLRATSESWIEVLDARGAVLLSRTLQPGEQVGLSGVMPMQLTIGNAASTTVQWRGQPVDLASHTRDNVARLEVR